MDNLLLFTINRYLILYLIPRLAEDLDPEADRASVTDTSAARTTICWKCKSTPAPGSKLRYCGRCETATYCSRPCARADWATHKLTCETLRHSQISWLGEVRQRISIEAATICEVGFKKYLACLTKLSSWYGPSGAMRPSYVP
jgi:hypothetical protein